MHRNDVATAVDDWTSRVPRLTLRVVLNRLVDRGPVRVTAGVCLRDDALHERVLGVPQREAGEIDLQTRRDVLHRPVQVRDRLIDVDLHESEVVAFGRSDHPCVPRDICVAAGRHLQRGCARHHMVVGDGKAVGRDEEARAAPTHGFGIAAGFTE